MQASYSPTAGRATAAARWRRHDPLAGGENLPDSNVLPTAHFLPATMLEKLPEALGHALRHRRAGLDKIAAHRLPPREGDGVIQLASLAFEDHGAIPARYTADGEGLSPPLHWSAVPPGARSLLLIVEDADSPTPQPLVHAIVADLPPAEGSLAEGDMDAPEEVEAGSAADATGAPAANAHAGRNSLLRAGWLPPDPPPGHGPHRYVFQLFALAEPPEPLSEHPGRDEVLMALADAAIANGLLVGTYQRHDGTVPDEANAQRVSGAATPRPGGLPDAARDAEGQADPVPVSTGPAVPV